jgi:PAS domain S-box-containing protein
LRFLLLQQFIGVASAASLILAVGADELRGRDALRETQTRLTLALEAGQLGFWDWDVPSGRVQFGGRWASMLGYQLDELEPHVRAWEHLVHPDDLARVTGTLRDHLEWRTEFYECEHRLGHKDGSWRWILARGRVVARDDRGKPLRVVGTHADVSDQRHAEAALRESETRVRLAAEAAGIGFWAVDVERRTCVLDEIAAGFVRVAPGVAIPLDEVAAAVHPDDYAQMQTAMGDAAASGERYEMEFRVLEPDGGVRWIAALGNSVQEQDTPRRLAGVNWDVTDRKRAEQERERLLESERAARTEAEHASRLKDDFLSTVSHELRTPLTAIIGWSQVLRLKVQGQDAELDRGLRAIDRNGRAQVQLVEDLLDMSRIVSGKLRLNVQPVDLREVVEAAVTSVAPSIEAGALHLQTVLSPTAGVVHGDPQRLQQVVWNLLSNAVKFTPAGGTIQVTLARVGGFAEITVADTGKGISAEFLPHVFDRFRQADASTTRQFGGLGLGLSIVKNLVDLHAGSLRVSSAGEGKGASFTVALPLALTHAHVGISQGWPAEDMDQQGAAPHEPFDLAGLSVLFVDDAADAREVVSMLLEERHARVRTAACAEDALRLLEAERPDVIVSDIGMPGMDGYAFMRRVRALPPERGGDVPAVALTAFARAEDRTAALRAGFQSHLSKPVHPPELMAAICALVATGARASRG